MDFGILQKNLKTIYLQRNYSLCLNVFLAFALIITLVIILKRSNNHSTIIIPATLSQKVQITESTVDDAFLIQWSEFIATLKLNVTPDNIQEKYNNILTFTDSSQYGLLKEHLEKERTILKSNEMSTVFFPGETVVSDKAGLTTKIKGVLRVYIGDELNKTSKVTYELKFKYDNGRLLLKNFTEVERV
ncbi:MAG: type IV conjugative transfer system protein TraE [Rickettsiaceae bacterium]|nr:type IV conjugative transfer system protein TraE [Rickettsiaceae bacterium]